MFEKDFYPKVIVGEIHDYLQSGGVALVKLIESKGYQVEVTGYRHTGNVCRQITCIKEFYH
jgi:hypothetical protein